MFISQNIYSIILTNHCTEPIIYKHNAYSDIGTYYNDDIIIKWLGDFDTLKEAEEFKHKWISSFVYTINGQYPNMHIYKRQKVSEDKNNICVKNYLTDAIEIVEKSNCFNSIENALIEYTERLQESIHKFYSNPNFVTGLSTSNGKLEITNIPQWEITTNCDCCGKKSKKKK